MLSRFAAICGGIGRIIGVIRAFQAIEITGTFVSPLAPRGVVIGTIAPLLGLGILALAARLWSLLELPPCATDRLATTNRVHLSSPEFRTTPVGCGSMTPWSRCRRPTPTAGGRGASRSASCWSTRPERATCGVRRSSLCPG